MSFGPCVSPAMAICTASLTSAGFMPDLFDGFLCCQSRALRERAERWRRGARCSATDPYCRDRRDDKARGRAETRVAKWRYLLRGCSICPQTTSCGPASSHFPGVCAGAWWAPVGDCGRQNSGSAGARRPAGPRRLVSRLLHRSVRERRRRGSLRPGREHLAAELSRRSRGRGGSIPPAASPRNSTGAAPRFALRFPAGEIARDAGAGAVRDVDRTSMAWRCAIGNSDSRSYFLRPRRPIRWRRRNGSATKARATTSATCAAHLAIRCSASACCNSAIRHVSSSRSAKKTAASDLVSGIVDYQETASPAMIRGEANRDLFAHGRVWIDSINGSVLKTENTGRTANRPRTDRHDIPH